MTTPKSTPRAIKPSTRALQSIIVGALVVSTPWWTGCLETSEADLIESLEADIQLVCSPACTKTQTCDTSSGCCIGGLGVDVCDESFPSPDTTVNAYYQSRNAHSKIAAISNTVYGATGCDGRFAVNYSYDDGNPSTNDTPGQWWDRITASILTSQVPKSKCACENMEITLEVSDMACAGGCAVDGFCYPSGGSCCDSNDCDPGSACFGGDPGPLCVPGAIARKTIRGNWSLDLTTGTYGCAHTVMIDRGDAPSGLTFEGRFPAARAIVIDKLTGAKKRVTITAYND